MNTLPGDYIGLAGLIVIIIGQLVLARYGHRADKQLHNNHDSNLRDDVTGLAQRIGRIERLIETRLQ